MYGALQDLPAFAPRPMRSRLDNAATGERPNTEAAVRADVGMLVDDHRGESG